MSVVLCPIHGPSDWTVSGEGDSVLCVLCVEDAVRMIREGRTAEAAEHLRRIDRVPSNLLTGSSIGTRRQRVSSDRHLNLDYWEGRRMLLRLGACLAKADIELAGVPLELAVYRANALEWLSRKVSFPEDDIERWADMARDCCVNHGPDFIDEQSAELWPVLETDYMRVLEVMSS